MSKFIETIIALHRIDGQRWLISLPDLLAKYAQLWDMEIGAPFRDLCYNYVAPAWRPNGTRLVIKTGFPNPELDAEIAALRHFEACGMVNLLQADNENSIFLLERLIPGKSLWEMEDEKAVNILLNILPSIWKIYQGDYPFPTVKDWSKGFSRLRNRYLGETGPFAIRLVEKAEDIFFELIASSDEPVLLHGDLHHGNILSAEREPWLAIDPKGVIGEPCYEVGAFLRNPMPGLLEKENPRALLKQRVDQIVERLGFDRQRVIGWAFSQAVLAAIWCEEDNLSCGNEFINCAQIIESL